MKITAGGLFRYAYRGVHLHRGINMNCKHCQAAREALINGKILEAAKHIINKVTEKKPAPVKKSSGAAGKSPSK